MKETMQDMTRIVRQIMVGVTGSLEGVLAALSRAILLQPTEQSQASHFAPGGFPRVLHEHGRRAEMGSCEHRHAIRVRVKNWKQSRNSRAGHDTGILFSSSRDRRLPNCQTDNWDS